MCEIQLASENASNPLEFAGMDLATLMIMPLTLIHITFQAAKGKIG